MEIINEVQEAIIDGLSAIQIKKYILKNIQSSDFCDVLIEDPKFVKTIFENRIIKVIESNNDINEIKNILNNYLVSDNNPDDPKHQAKLKLIRYIKSINEYLEEINFIEQHNYEYDEPIFQLRPNQIKALEKNKELNFISGVHIQVTGAGKSIIILRTFSDKLKYDKLINNNKFIYLLLTERIEILNSWFFIDGKLNKENIDFWKNNNIIDFDEFQIFDTIINKDKKLFHKINNTTKPTLVIMNNAQFRLKYQELNINNISLCIIDESHSVSGPEIYKALKYLKSNSIIGFSATPIRKQKQSIHQICDIFGTNGKLNILSLYDNIHALQDDVILPYKFIITSIKNKIDHKSILKKILNKEFENLPYKKIITWCKKISDINEYVEYFKNNFLELDVYYTHSNEINDNIEKFYKKDNNAILLCVGRCREGCDIKNVDCGIYLDRVKNRSILVSQQCNGRIIRPDKDGLKKYGLIIENIYEQNESIEYLTVQRLMSYYESILSLTDNATEYDFIDIINEFKKIYKNTIFSPEKEEITIKVDDNNNHDIIIKVEIKDLNWTLMKQFLNEKMIEKLDYDNKLKTEFELLKSEIKKLNLKHKNDYLLLDYEKNPNVKYHNHGWIDWYDFLGIDISIYPLFENWKNKCKKYKLTNEDDYYLNYEKYNLPSMPFELYKNFSSFYKEFNDSLNR